MEENFVLGCEKQSAYVGHVWLVAKGSLRSGVRHADIPIAVRRRRAAAFGEACVISRSTDKNYKFSLSLHQVVAARSSLDHAHHNKRITRRLARAHCKQCVSGIPSLFMRDHIPEGFLLFAFQLFIFFLVTFKLFDSIDTCITVRIDYELFVSPFNRSIVYKASLLCCVESYLLIHFFPNFGMSK